MALAAAPSLDDPQAARAARGDWLSLALIDARNRTLRWLAAFEAGHHEHQGVEGAEPPLRRIGRAGWFQEWWIARHLQRGRGEAAEAGARRLPSCEPRADEWFDPAHGRPWHPSRAPDADGVRAYLASTLETTLELLAATPDSDAGLHVFRLALLAEDRLAERLAEQARWLGLQDDAAGSPLGPPPARVERDPLWLPAGRARVGHPHAPGLVPPNERWALDVAVPEFEIDAQPVSWRRFMEFAEDGGYDRAELWSPAGWAWVQAAGRRAPRGVAQLRGAAWLERGGATQRAASGQPVAHASWHEAQAWCRWAGRRLPTEVEWEQAAARAGGRGFTWGDVWEWTLGAACAWPGSGAAPGAACVVAGFAPVPADEPRRTPSGEPWRVLRGASSWTVRRCRAPTVRRFAEPGADHGFFGFRSCAT